MRVRERWKGLGLGSASPIELLAIMLARNPDDADANESLARKLLMRHQVEGLARLAPADLAEAGLDDAECRRLLAAVELGRRSALAAKPLPDRIDRPEDAFALFEDLAREPQEMFVAAFLDTKNGLISRRTIHVGTLQASLVGAREIFREAVRENAASVVIAHNHPSGDPEPSPEDIEVTRYLKEAGKLLDIPVVDHIVVGRSRSVSLAQRGHL